MVNLWFIMVNNWNNNISGWGWLEHGWILTFQKQLGMECHHPNWRSHIVRRGRYTTKQYIFHRFVKREPCGKSIRNGGHRMKSVYSYRGFLVFPCFTGPLKIAIHVCLATDLFDRLKDGDNWSWKFLPLIISRGGGKSIDNVGNLNNTPTMTGDGLYHFYPFMVILGMVYYWTCHIADVLSSQSRKMLQASGNWKRTFVGFPVNSWTYVTYVLCSLRFNQPLVFCDPTF